MLRLLEKLKYIVYPYSTCSSTDIVMAIENIKAIIRGYLKDIDCIRIYEIREEGKKVMST